jgi:hypothetical protein
MIFHSAKKKIEDGEPKIKINNNPVEQCKEFDFLGITLNEHLDWKSHMDKISKKISRAIGIMYQLKRQLPPQILKTLYDSLIQCHLNYGLLSWGFNTTKLFKLQKKSVRIIVKAKYNAHTDPIFKELNILKIQDLFKLNVLKFYYKYQHNELPVFFKSFSITQRSTIHSYNTRNKKSLDIVRTKLKLSEKCLRYAIPITVNGTQPNVLLKIDTHSLQGFIKYTKLNFLKFYHTECFLSDCYVCNQN